ncbi:hypothetical protein MCEMIE4_01867 [Sphingobium cupriresistens]
MIRCPYTRDAVRNMLPIFKDNAHIARRVSNGAYSVSERDVRAMRVSRKRG